MAEPIKQLPVTGAPPVFEAKARAFFRAHRDARMAKGQWWLKLSGWLLPAGGLGVASGVAGFGAAVAGFPGAEIAGFLGVFVGLPMLIGGFVAKQSGQSLIALPEVVPDLQALLRALAQDWAAKQPLDGRIDLRDAKDAVSSERSAISPYSRATKLYYRHPWFRAAGKLADGTVLAIEGTALVKLKSGAEIRRELQLRGRLRPGPVLGRPDWRGGRRFGKLRTQVTEDAEVLFWAPVARMDEVLPDLEALVRAIAGAESPASHASDAGGTVGPAAG